MRSSITITSKGQTTLPVDIRRKLGLNNKGGVLQIDFDEQNGRLTITKPVTIDDVSARASKYIKPGTKPLTDVDDYYQTYRKMK